MKVLLHWNTMMTNECEICGMDCGVDLICETCLDEIDEYEVDEEQEWYDYDPDC